MKRIATVMAVWLAGSAAAHAAEVDGAKIYKSKCGSCHGQAGDGKTTTGKKLGIKDWTDGKVLKDLSDAQIKKLVREGVKGSDGKWKMSPLPKLDEDQVTAIVAYIRTLAKH